MRRFFPPLTELALFSELLPQQSLSRRPAHYSRYVLEDEPTRVTTATPKNGAGLFDAALPVENTISKGGISDTDNVFLSRRALERYIAAENEEGNRASPLSFSGDRGSHESVLGSEGVLVSEVPSQIFGGDRSYSSAEPSRPPPAAPATSSPIRTFSNVPMAKLSSLAAEPLSNPSASPQPHGDQRFPTASQHAPTTALPQREGLARLLEGKRKRRSALFSGEAARPANFERIMKRNDR